MGLNLGVLKKVTNASAVNENFVVFTANIKKTTANEICDAGVSITFNLKRTTGNEFFSWTEVFYG